MNPQESGVSIPSPSETNEDSIARHDPVPSSRSDAGELAPGPGNAAATTKINHSTFILVLVTLYTFLVLFAWSVICILTERPITTGYYGVWVWLDPGNDYGGDPKRLQGLYHKNENWYTAARVLQSIVGALTLPLTSTVCSSAAAVYAQRSQRWSPSSNLTLRQTMTLANRGWTDLTIYMRLLTKSGRKGYISPFLFLAMFLSILGFAIAPVQQIFLSTKTIKTPTIAQNSNDLLDIPNRFEHEYSHRTTTGLVILARRALETATLDNLQPQLWSGANTSCNILDILDNVTETGGRVPRYCFDGDRSLRSIFELPDPFLAQLPNGYNTGLIRQFIPRVNSSATYEVAEKGFPNNCDQIPGAYFVRYNNYTEASGGESWSVQVCMPGDLRYSPWRSTRARQDFSEELYINITVQDRPFDAIETNFSTPVSGEVYKVTVNTTAGYFELPNYMNGKVAGPLLKDNPNTMCGDDCFSQGYDPWSKDNVIPISPHRSTNKAKRRSEDDVPMSDDVESVTNKGPLLTTAMALFGSHSLLDKLLAFPDLYRTGRGSGQGTCVDLAPFGRFLQSAPVFFNRRESEVNTCIFQDAFESWATEIAESWLQNFRLGTQYLTQAFTAAAFLANQIWIADTPEFHTLNISYDMGADSGIPEISLAGRIFISILIGLDVLALYGMAIYACLFPRWTDTLDAFTMMRIGSSLGQKVPLKVAATADTVPVLDETPGWLGDMEEHGEYGRVGIGGLGRLKSRRPYECYDGQPRGQPTAPKESV